MTGREAAIVSCYTDYFIGDMGEIYKYLNELTGQSVYTHEIPTIIEVYKQRIKEDFINIKIEG